MADKIPPLPTSAIPGSYFWNDWIEKLRTFVNGFANGFPFSSITGLPTTLAGYGITDAEALIHKNQPSGYAGLNANSRVTKGTITTDYVTVDDSTKGVVLKSPNGHYWLISVSNAGTLSTTDLGTTAP